MIHLRCKSLFRFSTRKKIFLLWLNHWLNYMTSQETMKSSLLMMGAKIKPWKKKESITNSNIFYISLSRNFGHQNALRAGLDWSSGDVMITMDGDLQHPPDLISQMLKKWREGYEVVFTTRKDARLASSLKRKTAQWYSLN